MGVSKLYKGANNVLVFGTNTGQLICDSIRASLKEGYRSIIHINVSKKVTS
jgi:hypothetical protein